MEQEEEIWKIYKVAKLRNQYKIYKTNIYEISNFGRVKKNGEIYECKLNINGYLMFSGYFVHRAVAESFIPNPEGKSCVDHIDTNKLNNHVDNLRWVTYKENQNNYLTKKHISETMTGITRPEKTRKKMSKSKIGISLSIETRKKMSKSKIGRSWIIGPDNKRHWL